MVERVPFVLHNQDGEPIAGDLRYPREREHLPAVVVLHSFMAFKDWGWFPLVAERLALAGFAAVTFNFSRNGVRDSQGRITDFHSFTQNTISHELADVDSVLKSIAGGRVGSTVIDSKRIALLGHSRGGGLAILTTAENMMVRALVTWSSVCTFDRWTNHQKDQWRRRGFLPLSRDIAASPLRLGLGLLDDIEQNAERFNLRKASSRIRRPWLILHGTEDVLVKFSEAERLFSDSNAGTTDLLRLDRVGHTYGGPGPGADSAIHRVIDLSVEWLNSHFVSS
jgi:dienelactone hydrolase